MRLTGSGPGVPLLYAIVAEVVATVSMKAALDLPALAVVVLAGYVASFWCLALTLRRGMGVGKAYGIWGASGIVLAAVLSWAIYGETITPVMGVGFALIAVGVVLVEIGSSGGASPAGVTGSIPVVPMPGDAPLGEADVAEADPLDSDASQDGESR
ncbi:multidrug efflux SMR transporter [Galactobacter sp.]|uniref:DMT family transporter n=1 Tax=Galactobacter sp. TaxID=2676125 RepID=UPI00345DEEBC